MRSKQRDEDVNARLAAEGWTVLRFWDFEIVKELGRCVADVKRSLES